MGEVYRARDTRLERNVVLKRLIASWRSTILLRRWPITIIAVELDHGATSTNTGSQAVISPRRS
jgi:hypothetical protein